MGRHPADENLPEVVQVPQQQQSLMGGTSPLPEVVPHTGPEFAQQRYYMETDKYPAYYDTAPKLPYQQPPPGSAEQQYLGADPTISALSPNSSLPWQSLSPGGDDRQTFVGSEPQQEQRICGIRKRLFVIIAVIVGLIVVGAAVGGGVGGSMAATQSSSESDEAQPAETTSASSSSSSSSTTPTTSTATQSSTTSSASTPSITFLNNQTDPFLHQQFAFQAWSGDKYTGKNSPVIYDEGFFDFGFNATSYIWLPKNTDCCITYCASKTVDAGFRCDLRRQTSTGDDGEFPRVKIWCNRSTVTESERKKCS